MSLDKKTALVTGGARRIGKTCVRALAEKGYRVAIHYRESEEDAIRLKQELESTGSEILLIKADLELPDSPGDIFHQLKKNNFLPDILINSASIFPEDRFDNFSDVQLLRNSRINAEAPLKLIREMTRSVKKGTIINFLDTRITDMDSLHFTYHLSKRNLFSITRFCAAELAPDFTVNAIAPGLIIPPPGMDESYLEKRIDSNLLKKIGTLSEIANTLLFLVDSEFITGQVIYVDGGRHLKGCLY